MPAVNLEASREEYPHVPASALHGHWSSVRDHCTRFGRVRWAERCEGWRVAVYGGDAGSTKYSPLDQINRDNVKDLRIAWRWRTENLGARPDFNLESTPLMVDGVLYATAGARRNVVAINGVTGEQGARVHPQYTTEFETAFSVSWPRVPWNRGSWRSESPAALQALAPLRQPDGRVHFAGDYMTSLSSFMQGAFDSAREVATAIHKRALTRS